MVEQRNNDDDEFQDCVDDLAQSKCSDLKYLELLFSYLQSSRIEGVKRYSENAVS
jgi:hypothetical protein